MRKSLLLFMFALVLAAGLAGPSCSSSSKGGEGTSTPNPPSQAPSPAASASAEDPIDIIIKDLVIERIGVDRRLRVRDKHYYTDPSGTSWIGFGVEIIYDKGLDLPIGVVKRVPGGEWELAALGTGELPIPDDVKKGLGIDY